MRTIIAILIISLMGSTMPSPCAASAPEADPAETPDAEVMESVNQHFKPEKPALVMTFDVSYRLLFLNLMRVADARIETTEGRWTSRISTNSVPAYLMVFDINSPDKERAARKDMISIRDRLIAVLSVPDLALITTIKVADEIIHTPLSRQKRLHYTDTYDYESGILQYRHEDHLTGLARATRSQSSAAPSPAPQFAPMLKLLSEVYRQQTGAPDASSPLKTNVSIDGQPQPFTAHWQYASLSARFPDTSLRVLRVDLRQDKDAGKGGRCTLWTLPLRDLAPHIHHQALSALADTLPEWILIPMILDYNLTVGSVRCTLTHLDGKLPGQKAEAPDSSRQP